MERGELSVKSVALTDAVLALCGETADYEALKDQLRLAAVGVEAHIREAILCGRNPEAVAQLKDAQRDGREVAHWLSVLERNGIVSKKKAEAVFLLQEALQRRLGRVIREREKRLAEAAERPKEVTVSSSRLTLRHMGWQLAPLLPSLFEEGVWERLGFACPNRERAGELVRRWQTGDEMLAIIRSSDERLIGVVGLMREPPAHARRVLVAIAPHARLCGYATEALRCALAYGFSRLGMTVAVAQLPMADRVMSKILRHCGFSEEGLLRRAAEDGNDLLRLSLLREEYE